MANSTDQEPSSSSSASSSFTLPISVSAQVGVAILSLAFILGFPGNLFVVWSVLCRVRKRSLTCVLVLNLALADAFLLLGAPLFLRYLIGGRGWEFGSAACKLVHYLSAVNMYVSIYLICLMSMDRWLAVNKPFLSQRLRTRRSLLAVLMAIWVLAFLLSLPMPFYRRYDPRAFLPLLLFPPALLIDSNVLFPSASNLKKTLPNNITLNFCVSYHWNSVGHEAFQYLFETIMGCLLPFTLINTCYSSVLCRLQNTRFQRRSQGSCLILAIICAFAVFWLPYHIVNLIQVRPLCSETASVRAGFGHCCPAHGCPSFLPLRALVSLFQMMFLPMTC